MRNYATEIAKMKKGEFSPVYLFLGKESYFNQEARETLLNFSMEEADKELNVGIYNMEEVPLGSALEDAESMPFFGERRLVIVENPYFLTGEKNKSNLDHDLEWLEGYLNHPSESTILVFFAPYEKLDNRKKISKTLKKKAMTVDVSALDSNETRKFLNGFIKNQGYQMERNTLQFFFEKIEDNLSRGMQELEKLFLAALEDKNITRKMVQDLVAHTLEQNIFELVTYVLKKDTERAIDIYRDLLLQKEEPIKINAILLGQFRLLLQVKVLAKLGYQQPDMAKVLKVHPYRVKLANQQVRNLSETILQNAYTGLVETERNLKTGAGLREVQFEMFMLKYAEI
ncbi:DNA polymerase III subunit delta [Jeotgalibaca sp. MA1X17-3]|uniref:DNA polymerase III subunit delta n=1 Tax=Jeotgalibaca sp. MA1X17-3 TaxID=2908211 RepID=UPI001F26297D|nr:DNA polymerase III subunit delta [Jeotgalibaca sp. MA1X17-3]UJF14964.1 DNA polymerase III subunit delta [Jeotgalibaca sp. MA1X17-3]